MKIMALNGNGFRGTRDWKRDADGYEKEHHVINFCDFLDQTLGVQDVLIFSEFPYKRYNEKEKVWTESNIHLFAEKVITAGYRILYPNHLIDAYQCTVAIVRKECECWKRMEVDREKMIYDEQHSYGNKLIELQYGDTDITLLGVHMRTEEKMWDMILDGIAKNPYTFIAGDFNAYEYRGEMWHYPKIMRDAGYTPFIPSTVITAPDSESSIDNIYVNVKYKLKGDVLVQVKPADGFITDHKLCTCTIEI